MSISREQLNQNKEMKTADPFLLGLFMRDNEMCNISHAPGLIGIQFSNTKCIGVIDPEGLQKI